MALDDRLVRWGYALPLPDALLLGITHLATKGGLWLLAGLGLAAFGRGGSRRTGLALLAGLVAHVALLEGVLKHAIGRPRPCVTLGIAIRDNLVDATTYSFPSGHSAASFLGAWVIGTRFPRLRAPLLGLAGLVACSRVALGAHYPSDVAAGAVFGMLLGVAMVRVFRVRPRHEDTPPGTSEDAAPDGASV